MVSGKGFDFAEASPSAAKIESVVVPFNLMAASRTRDGEEWIQRRCWVV
jgi:hypothetical protein